jgi:iron(III) transport system ATP-binding protein
MAVAVEFNSVTKRYGGVVAVDAVSFAVEAGTLVTLLGPSGCGKTTTLRLVAGLELPSEGTIRIGGRDVSRLPASARNVSMVFQSYALFPHMNVLENAAYGPRVAGKARDEAHAMARAKLDLLGLRGLEGRLPSELSGGQQQRVAVARALVLEPEVLLFDEPLSNLDAKLRRRVRDEIRDLQKSLKLTVVYVTHDQQEALAVSDRVIVMSNAKIAQAGSPRDLYDAPASNFVADFIGDANLVDGELRRIDGDMAEIALGPLVLNLPARGLKPGPVKLALRPEAVDVVPAANADLVGTVRRAAYVGSVVEYVLETPIGPLFVTDRATERAAPPGSEVGLVLMPRGVTLVPY